ncbi:MULTISPECIES: hypothetical protein [unclassified Cupriavidus]|uniref:hypothetical protein n=1 Tax=unclassified Cupriavidus TaxID=2640874 RepID=UPI003F91E27B
MPRISLGEHALPEGAKVGIQNDPSNGNRAAAPWVKPLVTAYQSQEVRDFLARQFKGAILPAF